jgi:hypothetical protein
MALREIQSNVPIETSKLKKAANIPLMWTPNIFSPKLFKNLRSPFTEILHGHHRQYAVDMIEGVEYHVVEHGLGLMDMAVDVVAVDSFPQGLIPRIRQLFRQDFYYGHAQYFPQPFRLIARSGEEAIYHKEEFVNRVLEEERQRVAATKQKSS